MGAVDRLSLRVDGVDRTLDAATWGPQPATVVFAHEGLGSIDQWRDVPERVATQGRLGVLAYNRSGHGTSRPVPTGAWPADWMTREAVVLAGLIEQACAPPVRLVGHSDGATIALLCAAARPELVSDVISLAAHSWVESKCVEAIRQLRGDADRLIRGLAKYHAHPAELFAAWSGGWLADKFAAWDIRPQLRAVRAPVLVVQGADDAYATDVMATQTATAIGSTARARIVPGAGHLLHRDVPADVVRWAIAGAADD